MRCLEQLVPLSLKVLTLFLFVVGVSLASTTDKLTQLRVEEELKAYLAKYKNIEIQNISIPKISPITGKKIKTEVLERTKTPSYIYITYKIYKNGTLYKTLPISVKYRKVSYIVFSKTDIKKGEYISREKVYLKRYRGRVSHMFTNIQDVIGQKAKINIRKDTPIKEYMLVPDYLVLRGSNVKIIYNKGVIHIELLGKALENGTKNQIIKVKNISSGKVIPCKVIGRNQVLFIGGSF